MTLVFVPVSHATPLSSISIGAITTVDISVHLSRPRRISTTNLARGSLILKLYWGYASIFPLAHCNRYSPLHRHLLKPRLKRSRPEQEFDYVPFVRLKPIELNRRHRPQIQTINVSCID